MQLENMFKKYVHLLRDTHACTASPHRNSTSVLSEVVFERSNTSVSSQTGVSYSVWKCVECMSSFIWQLYINVNVCVCMSMYLQQIS